MRGHEHSKGMSKSKTGLQSLSQGSWERVWNGEGQAGSGTRSSENRTKVCGWMGYAVGDLRTSLGHGEVWIGVLVQCYTECNSWKGYGAADDLWIPAKEAVGAKCVTVVTPRVTPRVAVVTPRVTPRVVVVTPSQLQYLL